MTKHEKQLAERDARLAAIIELCRLAMQGPSRSQDWYCAYIRRIQEIAEGKA